jgi:L-asparaginase
VNDRHRPRVAVYSLGGTIAMTAQADGTVAPALSAKELLAAVPQISGLDVDLEVRDFRQAPGASLTFADLFALADEIENAAARGADGVVVTQGTDTIEETSYLLELRRQADIPIIVTGAMRNPTMAGADGPANILAALRVASSPKAPRQALVVFADEIHAASRVRKSHSTSVTAFTSWPGALGYVAEDQVILTAAVPPGPHVTGEAQAHPRTAVATIALGDDGEVLRAVGGQVDGLVVAAFGAGHVPSACVPVLNDLAQRIPVILASRTCAGPVLSKTYGFPGSESDLLSRGLISAGTLTPVKAKILLHTALMVGADKSGIQEFFAAANASKPSDRG